MGSSKVGLSSVESQCNCWKCPAIFQLKIQRPVGPHYFYTPPTCILHITYHFNSEKILRKKAEWNWKFSKIEFAFANPEKKWINENCYGTKPLISSISGACFVKYRTTWKTVCNLETVEEKANNGNLASAAARLSGNSNLSLGTVQLRLGLTAFICWFDSIFFLCDQTVTWLH